jgi:hypothetical protein
MVENSLNYIDIIYNIKIIESMLLDLNNIIYREVIYYA